MPAYQYECPDHHGFARYAPMAQATDKAQCPECGRMAERVLSAPMLRRDGAYSWRPDEKGAAA